MKHEDDYANTITGLGISDKSRGNRSIPGVDLDSDACDNLYEEALPARIVDRIVYDAIREGFEIESEEDVDRAGVMSQCEDLEVLTECGDAWRWSRLYGGALAFLNTQDGLKMDQPLNLRAATRLLDIQVLESPQVQPALYDPGLGSRSFRRPEYYDVSVPLISTSGARRIHKSRVIRFDGIRVPHRAV